LAGRRRQWLGAERDLPRCRETKRPRGVRGDRHRQGSGGARPSQQPRARGLPRQLAAGSAVITVHHLNNSRSQRILWMLEELGVPYEVKRYQREPSMQAPASLRAVHPLGKSPVITDGDRTLAESGAILEYLVDAYGNGRFRPASGTPEKINYTYF